MTLLIGQAVYVSSASFAFSTINDESLRKGTGPVSFHDLHSGQINFIVIFSNLWSLVSISLHVRNCGVTHSSMGNQPVAMPPKKNVTCIFYSVAAGCMRSAGCRQMSVFPRIEKKGTLGTLFMLGKKMSELREKGLIVSVYCRGKAWLLNQSGPRGGRIL